MNRCKSYSRSWCLMKHVSPSQRKSHLYIWYQLHLVRKNLSCHFKNTAKSNTKNILNSFFTRYSVWSQDREWITYMNQCWKFKKPSSSSREAKKMFERFISKIEKYYFTVSCRYLNCKPSCPCQIKVKLH